MQGICEVCENGFTIIVKSFKEKKCCSRECGRRKVDLWNRFRITPAYYNELLKKQNYVCAICHRSENKEQYLSIDHCHSSNRIRGLLCNNCNFAIGLLNDDPEVIRNAARYVEEF